MHHDALRASSTYPKPLRRSRPHELDELHGDRLRRLPSIQAHQTGALKRVRHFPAQLLFFPERWQTLVMTGIHKPSRGIL